MVEKTEGCQKVRDDVDRLIYLYLGKYDFFSSFVRLDGCGKKCVFAPKFSVCSGEVKPSEMLSLSEKIESPRK